MDKTRVNDLKLLSNMRLSLQESKSAINCLLYYSNCSHAYSITSAFQENADLHQNSATNDQYHNIIYKYAKKSPKKCHNQWI